MSLDELSCRMAVPRTTLIEWISRWEADRLAPRARGAPPRRATAEERRCVIETLEREGVGVGVAELGRRFPSVARRELAEIVSTYGRWRARKGHEARYRLEWPRPGAVWAMDFTITPCLVDGFFGKLAQARDLSSGMQLAADPAMSESAWEVFMTLSILFATHGAPLVIKLDNGPGFVSQEVRDLCARHGVLILYSPPYTPQYNGSCEAGGGAMKARTQRIAAGAGRPTAWTSDDVEHARLQANHCVRDRGPRGPSPGELWDARRPISGEERALFLEEYRQRELTERRSRDIPPNAPLNRATQAMIDRAAIAAALTERELLRYRRA